MLRTSQPFGHARHSPMPADNPYAPSLTASARIEPETIAATPIPFSVTRTRGDLVHLYRRPYLLAVLGTVAASVLLPAFLVPLVSFLVGDFDAADGLFLVVLLAGSAGVASLLWRLAGFGAARARLRQFPHLIGPIEGVFRDGRLEAVTRQGWIQVPLDSAHGIRLRSTYLALAFDAACQQPVVLPARAFTGDGFDRATVLLAPLQEGRPLVQRPALTHDPRMSDAERIERLAPPRGTRIGWDGATDAPSAKPSAETPTESPEAPSAKPPAKAPPDAPPHGRKPDGRPGAAVPFDGPIRTTHILRTRLRRHLAWTLLRVAGLYLLLLAPLGLLLWISDGFLLPLVLAGFLLFSLVRVFRSVWQLFRDPQRIWSWSQGFVLEDGVQYAHPLGRSGIRWSALAGAELGAGVIRLQAPGRARMSWFLTREQFADDAAWQEARELVRHGTDSFSSSMGSAGAPP